MSNIPSTPFPPNNAPFAHKKVHTFSFVEKAKGNILLLQSHAHKHNSNDKT
jgi:hypothetical protein